MSRLKETITVVVLAMSFIELHREDRLRAHIRSLETMLTAHGVAHGVTNRADLTNPTVYRQIPASTNKS